MWWVNSTYWILPALTASPSYASTGRAAECSFKCSGSIVLVLLPSGTAGFGPIESALLPDVEEPRKNQNYEDQPLEKAKHLKIAENHHPGIQENGFNVEQNEKHAHQVELHAEAMPRIARRHDAGFVGHVFDAIAYLLAEQVGSRQQPRPQTHCADTLEHDRQIELSVGLSNAF